jgi:IS30 family transposase
MADYAFRSFDERQKIQGMWEAGLSAQNIADEMELSLSSVYTELRRGYDGTRLPNKRRRYDADLAQLRVQESLERRGRRKAAGQ